MENGPLVVSANFCNPFDDRALSKNAFPLFRLCPTASHIHPDFPLLFRLLDTSAFVVTYLAVNFRFPGHPTRIRTCYLHATSFGPVPSSIRIVAGCAAS